MKKTALTLWTIWVGLMFVVISSQAQETAPKFNLKLSGGYGKIIGGDLPSVIDGINNLVMDQAARTGASVSSWLENAEWGPELEFEFVIKINQRFGVGLGLGYIYRQNDTLVALGLSTLLETSLAMKYTSSAIPILLSGYYFLPLGAKTQAYLKAGAGYYFGRLNSDLREEANIGGITLWGENKAETNDSSLGFHGGIGFDYKLSRTVALFAEAAGRCIKLNNWEGDNIYSAAWGSNKEHGYFWYVEELNHDTGKHYATLLMLPHEPTWAEYRNIRKAEFSFSGIALKLGVRIGF